VRGQFGMVNVQLGIEGREHGRPDALKAIPVIEE
jgi:hypothetical protein